MAVREAVNAQLRVDVPGLGKTSVDNVLVHELPDAAGVSPNALVWGAGQVDAAPCGSGTCARLALFHHRGLMGVGTTYLTGFSQFLFDPDDPMRAGYLLDV